jgi:pimeloyl-ACP methyl ester carboxylesterase
MVSNAPALLPALQQWLDGGTFLEHAGRRHFVRRGGSGPPLLLVHGYPFSSFDWHRVWDRLATSHSLVAPDMLGMGFSDKPERHVYSIAGHADLFEAVLANEGLDRVRVLAHDLGVSVVQEMLARQQTDAKLPRFTSIVFLNGGLFPETYRPRWIQRALSSPLGDWLGPRVPRRMFERALARVFGPETQPSAADFETFWQLLNHRHGLRVTHAVGRFTSDRTRFRDRYVGALVASAVPMRLINGSLDPNSGAHMARRYRELVPNADVVDLPRIGHFPQLEDPHAVGEAALGFFARLDATDQAARIQSRGTSGTSR